MGGCCSDMVTVNVPIPTSIDGFNMFGVAYTQRVLQRLVTMLREDEKNVTKAISKERRKAKRNKKAAGADGTGWDSAGANVQHEANKRRVNLAHKLPGGTAAVETEESLVDLVTILGEMRKKTRKGEVFTVTNKHFERAASFIIANLRPLWRDPRRLVFPQRMRLARLETNHPQLSNSRKRALVKKFEKVNLKKNGEISTFELEMWLARRVESIGDSVFLPMLTRVVTPAHREFINIFEWMQMYDKFCVMKNEELLAFAFFQLASVGKEPGQFPRIVTPELMKEFPEFELAQKDLNNTNRPLLVELFRVGASVVDPMRPRKKPLASAGTKHKGAERMYATSLGHDPSTLVSFAEYKQISAQSKNSINQALFYMQRTMQKDLFGGKFWGRRRREVMKRRRGEANRDALMSPEGKTFDKPEPVETPPTPPAPTDGEALMSDDDWKLSHRGTAGAATRTREDADDDGSRPAKVGGRGRRSNASASKYFVPGDGGDQAVDSKADDRDDGDDGDDGSRPADVGARRPKGKIVSGVQETKASDGTEPVDDSDDDGSKPARPGARRSLGPRQHSIDGINVKPGPTGVASVVVTPGPNQIDGISVRPNNQIDGIEVKPGPNRIDNISVKTKAAAGGGGANIVPPSESPVPGDAARPKLEPLHVRSPGVASAAAVADSPGRSTIVSEGRTPLSGLATKRFETFEDEEPARATPDLGDERASDSPMRSEMVSGAGASDAVVLSVTMGGRKKAKNRGPHSLAK